jgi:hypothetical protein
LTRRENTVTNVADFTCVNLCAAYAAVAVNIALTEADAVSPALDAVTAGGAYRVLTIVPTDRPSVYACTSVYTRAPQCLRICKPHLSCVNLFTATNERKCM